MMKKILVLGGTGAMGKYVVPELVSRGYQVDVVSLDDVKNTADNPTYYKKNVKDPGELDAFLSRNYDGIIDYMIWNTKEFQAVYEKFLRATDHYIYLSSYRIYAGEYPVTETSPRLLDVSDDQEYLATEDYSLYKARGENILRASGRKNWTIVRPAITYSLDRYQLVTLEAQQVVNRAFDGKTVVLPEPAADIQATMSWAGDAAKMFAGILFNPRAMGEAFTFSTSEHHTWREIAEYYAELIGLKYLFVDEQTYLDILSPNNMYAKWQLEYDRMFNRVIDNSKILDVAGLKQSDFMPLKEGLRYELSRISRDKRYPDPGHANERMDAYLASIGKK